jgi:death-on-curing protein
MLTIAEVEKIHAVLIEKFGGGKGIRDLGLLESALVRPFNTFEGQELYPEPVDKAAAVLESVVMNHPFVDGNKRTGYVLARLLLMNNGWDIEASQNAKYDFVVAVATGEMRFDEIRSWLKAHVVKTKNL